MIHFLFRQKAENMVFTLRQTGGGTDASSPSWRSCNINKLAVEPTFPIPHGGDHGMV